MLAEEVQAAVQMSIRCPESQAWLFLRNPRLHPEHIPFMTPQIYAQVNSSELLRTLNLREVGLLKCLQPNLNLSGMAFLNTCGIFLPPIFSLLSPQENHIIYSAISREYCG